MKPPNLIEALFWLTFLAMILLSLLCVAFVVGNLLQLSVQAASVWPR